MDIGTYKIRKLVGNPHVNMNLPNSKLVVMLECFQNCVLFSRRGV